MEKEKITIKDLAILWRKDKRQYVKQSTYSAYALIIENQINPTFGNLYVITESEVQAFVIDRLNSGLSQKYVKDILIVLKMIVRFGEKHGYLQHCEWDIKYPTAPEKQGIEVLTASNHRKILDYISQNFTFRNLGIYICLTTGLRIGEVCGLKWSDLDVDCSMLTVQRTVERIYILEDDGTKHTHIVVNTPKTANSLREIPLSKTLMTMIRPLKKVVNSDYYVISNEPHPIEPRTYRNYYVKLMKQLGIPPLKFHGLRHSPPAASKATATTRPSASFWVMLTYPPLSTSTSTPEQSKRKSASTKCSASSDTENITATKVWFGSGFIYARTNLNYKWRLSQKEIVIGFC